MRHDIAEDAVWHLEVADGPNAGAIVPLMEGRYLLGTGTANDIILADPAVAPEHAAMEFSGDGLSITALGSGIQLRRRLLARGEQCKLRHGTVIRLGETSLQLTAPKKLGQRRQHSRLICCVVALAIAGAVVMYGSAIPTSIDVRATTSTALAASAPATLSQAAALLHAHLAESVATRDIIITASNGAMIATGTVGPADQAAWIDAQQWFDRRFGNHYALSDRVTVAKSDLPELDVAAVSMAPVPSIITRNGDHYTVGAILSHGWYIADIAPNVITLRSGARELHINL